jgi:hypothetical protein
MMQYSSDFMETFSGCLIGINVEFDIWNEDRTNDLAMQRMISYYVRLVAMMIITVSEEVDWK